MSGLAIVSLIVLGLGADSPDGAGRRADQAALAPFASLVGPWKGTGLVRRGSSQGAWREAGEWVWDLDADSASLVLRVPDGKHLMELRVRPGDAAGRFRLVATLKDGRELALDGARKGKDGPVVAIVDGAPEGQIARMTLTPLHATRFLLRLEAAGGSEGVYRPIGEVGYTREGVAFAAGDGQPECIVTGGRGTIRVSYRGKDYWVCCSGCKDLFDEDPAAALAEADRARREGAEGRP